MIVASCCRPLGLAVLLAALSEQAGVDSSRFECVVAWYGTDGEQRGSYRRILSNQKFPVVSVEIGQPSGPGIFRNHAIARSSGALLFCMDDDCVPAADCLAECLRYAGCEPGVSAWGGVTETGGGVHATDRPSLFASRLDETWREPKTDAAGHVCFIPGLHFVIRRSAYLQSGGFPSGFAMVGEDSALCLELSRRNLRMGFNPRQVIRHDPVHGIGGLAARIFAYGRANGRLRRVYRDVYPPWSVRRSLNLYRPPAGRAGGAWIIHCLRNILYHAGQLLEILR